MSADDDFGAIFGGACGEAGAGGRRRSGPAERGARSADSGAAADAAQVDYLLDTGGGAAANEAGGEAADDIYGELYADTADDTCVAHAHARSQRAHGTRNRGAAENGEAADECVGSGSAIESNH